MRTEMAVAMANDLYRWTTVLAVFSVVLLCLCVYELRQRSKARRRIGFAWLLYALGFGSLGSMFYVMAETVGLRTAEKPTGLVAGLFCAGAVLFIMASSVLVRASKAMRHS